MGITSPGLALGNSFHLLDAYTAYGNPLDIGNLNPLVVLDTGSTNPVDSETNAVAMAIWSVDPKVKMALSLGHQDDSVINNRLFMNAQAGTTFPLAQNPIDVFYAYSGDSVMHAFNIHYSTMIDKSQSEYEHSAVIAYGIQIGSGQVYGKYGLLNSSEVTGGTKFDGDGHINLAGRYGISSFTLGVDYFRYNAKSITGTTINQNHSYELIQAGLVDTRTKVGEEFFYGVQLNYLKVNCRTLAGVNCDSAYTRTTLPVWIGFEVAGNQWLTFRGFLKQNFLVDQMKDEVGYAADVFDQTSGAKTEYSGAPNSTELNTGIGVNFKKIAIDAVLTGIFTNPDYQNTRIDNLVSTVSLTYNY